MERSDLCMYHICTYSTFFTSLIISVSIGPTKQRMQRTNEDPTPKGDIALPRGEGTLKVR